MSPLGKWNIILKSPVGDHAGVLEFALDGADLCGTLSNDEHRITFGGGKIDGNTLKWSAELKKPMALKFKFTATVVGNQISGTAHHWLGSATFTGTR
jgi:hypothetical protein